MTILTASLVTLLFLAWVLLSCRSILRRRDQGPLGPVAGRKPTLRIHTRAGSPSQERPRPATGTDGLYDELRARTELRGQHTVVGFIQARKR